MKTSSTSTVRRSALAALEVPSILGVPAVLVACAVNGVQAATGLTLLVVVLCVGLFLASYEASRPALRQVMPTATLAALAAAGRILFAPIPDVKPVSAIAIVADTPGPCSPCGACRQVMAEFHIPKVIMANLKGEWCVVTLDQLLPYAFSDTDL